MKRFFISLAIVVLFVAGSYVVFVPRLARQDEPTDSRIGEVMSAASPDSPAPFSKPAEKHSSSSSQPTRLVIAVGR